MVIFKLKKFNEVTDKSQGVSFIELTYTTITGNNPVNVVGEVQFEITSHKFNKVGQNIKMSGTFDELYNYYNQA